MLFLNKMEDEKSYVPFLNFEEMSPAKQKQTSIKRQARDLAIDQQVPINVLNLINIFDEYADTDEYYNGNDDLI